MTDLVKLSASPTQEETDAIFDTLQEDGDAVLGIAPDGHCAFMYFAGDSHWCFDLLSEVGAPYQPTFRQLLAQNNLELTTVEERGENDELVDYYDAVSI